MDNGEGRWCDGADEGVVVVGRCIRKRKVGEGVWAEQPKPSRRDSISGALCEMAKGDGVVVCMRWRRPWGCAFVNARQRGGFGPKSETELLWLGLRRAVRNSDRGWCIEVVVVVVGLCAHETGGRQAGGLGQNPKPSRCGSI